MSDVTRAVMYRWFEEVWNQGRLETIDELFATHAVAHGLGDTEADIHGPEEFKVFVKNMRGAIPDFHIVVEDLICEGDWVAVRITASGTHTGEGLGVSPSNNRVHIQGLIMGRIVNGQLVEGWNSYDQLGLLRQINALPGAGKPDRFLSAAG